MEAGTDERTAAVPQGALTITAAPEIAHWLSELSRCATPVSVQGAQGGLIPAQVLTLDPAQDSLSLGVDLHHPALAGLVDADEATVVAYIDNIRLQFDVQGLMLVRGDQGGALHCAFPTEILRFQRRESFRVRPLLRTSPQVHFRHPMIPDMPLTLRLLDISLTGCALFLPDNVPPLDPGIQINDVRFALDLGTRFAASLKLQHVTGPQPGGVRLGFELMALNPIAQDTLARYINQNQKQQRLTGQHAQA